MLYLLIHLYIQLARVNSRKSVRWSAVPVPCLSRLWLRLRGKQGSGPKGVNDLCFHIYGEFFPPPSPPPPHPPTPQPLGPYLNLEAQLPGPNPSLKAKIPRDWNLGLGVGIWALRLGLGSQDWDLGLKAGIWASRLRYGPPG